jgi:ssDNA-binding Zn-finger/Zn-ribbon topoisomerase 1
MKFYGYAIDPTCRDKNGGTQVILHHGHALKFLGHEWGGLLDLNTPIPPDGDYIIFQSEWYRAINRHLELTKAKSICWLGTFLSNIIYDMPTIAEMGDRCDYFMTQWQGKCFAYAREMLQRYGKDLYYLPHAACHECDTEGVRIPAPTTIFIGHHYPERDENWLDGAKVTKLEVPLEDAKNYYKSAIVCPNCHGDFQRNKRTEFFEVEGEMINDRIFKIIAAGGFAISDNTPMVKEFFTEDEVPYCETKEEFIEKINYFVAHPDERKLYMEKAQARVKKDHLYYKHWEKYLPIIL